MLAGIGPGAQLQAHGIEVKNDLPGVGNNFVDHCGTFVRMHCTQPVSMQPALGKLRRLGVGLRWLMSKTGPAASNQFEASGFLRSRAHVRYPDLQLDFMPYTAYPGAKTLCVDHGFQVHCGPLRAHSRGHVRLASKHPGEAPLITYNYLDDERDRTDMRRAIRLAREIFAQPAFDAYRGRELTPGRDCESDETIDAYVRATAKTVYHPTSTCRMGVDANAVVDPQCRVHGVEGLRVVDASVMPMVTSGNTNAPTIMIAVKAADLIRGMAPPGAGRGRLPRRRRLAHAATPGRAASPSRGKPVRVNQLSLHASDAVAYFPISGTRFRKDGFLGKRDETVFLNVESPTSQGRRTR